MPIIRYFCVLIIIFIITQAYCKDFTIHDIAITEYAENSTTARKLAIQNASHKALEKLIYLLEPNATTIALDNIEKQEIESAIKYFSMTNEVITHDSYSATFTFTFKPENIEVILTKIPIEHEKKIIVIPLFYDKDDHAYLWDNVWHDAWTNDNDPDILVIKQDIQDTLSFKIKDITQHKKHILNDILDTYQANDLLIVEAIDNGQDVNVNIYRPYFEQVKKLNYASSSHHKPHFVMKKIVADVTKKIKHGISYPNFYETIQQHYFYNVVITDSKKWPLMREQIFNHFAYTVQYLADKLLVIEIKWHNNDIHELSDELKKYHLNIKNSNNNLIIS